MNLRRHLAMEIPADHRKSQIRAASPGQVLQVWAPGQWAEGLMATSLGETQEWALWERDCPGQLRQPTAVLETVPPWWGLLQVPASQDLGHSRRPGELGVGQCTELPGAGSQPSPWGQHHGETRIPLGLKQGGKAVGFNREEAVFKDTNRRLSAAGRTSVSAYQRRSLKIRQA